VRIVDIKPAIRPMPDKEAVHQLLLRRWNDDCVIFGGRAYTSRDFQADGAYAEDGALLALALWAMRGKVALLGAVDSIVPGSGAASALIAFVCQEARARGATKLRAVTTNDNTVALVYYQRQGFRLDTLFVGSVDAFRGRDNPNFRRIGFNGLPVRDTLELEMEL
jgi:ribosomal protein S18 acetylase RimI-like enzyme